jgi:hypothetical protein
MITARASVNLRRVEPLTPRPGDNRYAPFDDIGDGTGKHLETFGHLQSDHLRLILSDVVNGFVYLEGIIRGQLLDGIIYLDVGQNFLRDLVDDGDGYAWL